MAESKNPAVKKYMDYANTQVDEQAILDKYNAATTAQFNVQREQNRQNENKFYNQMYNTQQTAMDTIRKNNAAAVSSGASRGVQAANELSAILGLQQESVAGATELAQANQKTAQEETAAVLENVLKAYDQANKEKSQLVSQGIQAASVDMERANAQAANQVEQERLSAEIKQQYLDRLDKGDTAGALNIYFTDLHPEQKLSENMSAKDIAEGSAFMNQIGEQLIKKYHFNTGDFSAWDRTWGKEVKGETKVQNLAREITAIAKSVGLTEFSNYKANYADLSNALIPNSYTFNNVATQNERLPILINAFVNGFTEAANKLQNKNKD